MSIKDKDNIPNKLKPISFFKNDSSSNFDEFFNA